MPLLNTKPVEMGVAGREDEVLARFRDDGRYRQLFHRSFPEDEDPVSMRNVTQALASFERTLISGNSPYDRWRTAERWTGWTPMNARAHGCSSLKD